MYEKDFPQTNATIATLQVYQLVFSYLSVAIRAFSIITYCHLAAPQKVDTERWKTDGK